MNFNVEWRWELRAGRSSELRRRTCALRASTRTPFAAYPSVSRIVQVLRLKWLEGRLRLSKSWLKIRSAYNTQELQRIKLRMMLRLSDSFMPRHFMEQMLIKHVADCTWE